MSAWFSRTATRIAHAMGHSLMGIEAGTEADLLRAADSVKGGAT